MHYLGKTIVVVGLGLGLYYIYSESSVGGANSSKRKTADEKSEAYSEQASDLSTLGVDNQDKEDPLSNRSLAAQSNQEKTQPQSKILDSKNADQTPKYSEGNSPTLATKSFQTEEEYDNHVTAHQQQILETFSATVDYIPCEGRRCSFAMKHPSETVPEAMLPVQDLYSQYPSPAIEKVLLDGKDENFRVQVIYHESLADIIDEQEQNYSHKNLATQLGKSILKNIDPSEMLAADYIETAMGSFILLAKENSYLINDSKTELSCKNESCEYKYITPASLTIESANSEWSLILEYSRLLADRDKRLTAGIMQVTKDSENEDSPWTAWFTFKLDSRITPSNSN